MEPTRRDNRVGRAVSLIDLYVAISVGMTNRLPRLVTESIG